MIKKLIQIIMAKIDHRKFTPSPEEQKAGAAPMTTAEIVEQLMKYKAQNPVKYEAKKAALFARYGLTLEDEPVVEPDANDEELAKIAAKVKKSK